MFLCSQLDHISFVGIKTNEEFIGKGDAAFGFDQIKGMNGNETIASNVFLSDKMLSNASKTNDPHALVRKRIISLNDRYEAIIDNTKQNSVHKSDLRTSKKVRKSVLGDAMFTLVKPFSDTENGLSDQPMQDALPKTNQEELEAMKEEQQANAMMKMPETSKTENHPIFMNADGKEAGLPNDKSVISASFNSDIAIQTPGREKLPSNVELANTLPKVGGITNEHDSDIQKNLHNFDGLQNPALSDHAHSSHIPTDSNIPEFENKPKFLNNMQNIDAAQNRDLDEGVHSSEQISHSSENQDSTNNISESPIRDSNTDSLCSQDNQFPTPGDADVDSHITAESENAVNKQKINDDAGDTGESPVHNRDEYDDKEMQKGLSLIF